MITESKGRLGKGLYAIGTAELPGYLLDGATPALFDAGMTFAGPLYLEGLKTCLGDADRLSYLFLTHSHFDHGGAAPFLKKSIGGLKVGAHKLAADTFRKPNAVELIRSLSRDYEEKHLSPAEMELVAFDSLAVDILVEDGTEFDLGGGLSFRVIATPGHTKDSVSYYIPHLKALITGEAAGVYDRNFNIHPEFLASYRDYLESLEKLALLDLDILMMSHFFTLTGDDAGSYMAKAIAVTKDFRERIENYLKSSGGDREEVVRRIYREDFEETGAILQEARPYLINLQAKVRAVAENR